MQKSLISKFMLMTVMCLISIAGAFGQKKYTIDSYIEEHKEVAQQLMEETGVPASVILGVAIHESYFGNSRVAKHLNNHFGIKGKNSSKTIKSAYKGYASYIDSYKDFIGLLQRRKVTKSMFDKYDHTEYKAWISGISRSGYSATRSWSSKVLSIINRYDLDTLDII